MNIYKKQILFSLILVLVSIIGSFLNLFVVHSNGNLMPVYADWTWSDDDKHFIFTDKSEVNYFYLTDIIPIQLMKFKGRMSVGDILLFSAMILQITMGIIHLTKVWKMEKRKV